MVIMNIMSMIPLEWYIDQFKLNSNWPADISFTIVVQYDLEHYILYHSGVVRMSKGETLRFEKLCINLGVAKPQFVWEGRTN